MLTTPDLRDCMHSHINHNTTYIYNRYDTRFFYHISHFDFWVFKPGLSAVAPAAFTSISMNIDRLNLLSNYTPAEADWGIEETFQPRNRFNSTTTSEFSQPPHLRYSEFSHRSPSLSTGQFNFLSDHDFFSHVHMKPSLPSNTENFHKYIRFYLSLHEKTTQLVEKFKYNLVISNLLDDSLVLLKNEQALSNLVQMRSSVDEPIHARLIKQFNYDGSELLVTKKAYRLVLPRAYQTSPIVLHSIWLIVFLLKQNLNVRSNLLYTTRVKLFKILLIATTKAMKYRRGTAMIMAAKSLRTLDDFMISNCKINKALIATMITIKEYEMFVFLNQSDTERTNSAYSRNLKSHLNNVLSYIIINVRHSVSSLLPFSNGEFLEKYCQINNVQLGPIMSEVDIADEEDVSLDLLTSKLNHFNNMRRFFICQLLTIHDERLTNFFILKLFDSFNLNPENSKPSTKFSRLFALQHVLAEHTASLDLVLALNDKFKTLYSPSQTTDFVNDDVLTNVSYGMERRGMAPASEHEFNLSNLIDKLQNLSTSLKYFKKYSQSITTIEDADEYDEKLTIFKQFGGELKSSFEIYKACLSEYESELSQKFQSPSSASSPQCNSQHNSYNSNDQFSLKSFRTSSTATKKIASGNGADGSTEIRNPTPRLSDRKSRRVSTGLQLGLLTVLEEPRSGKSAPKRDAFAEDQVLPSNHDSFNQSALDALTKKIGIRNPKNRFSINSLSSNVSGISDLIASTHITNDEDDNDRSKGNISSAGLTQGMSKEDLKKKLEESFSRIYNLESENHELKSKSSGEATSDQHNHELDHDGDNYETERNLGFASELERTLEKGLSK